MQGAAWSYIEKMNVNEITCNVCKLDIVEDEKHFFHSTVTYIIMKDENFMKSVLNYFEISVI